MDLEEFVRKILDRTTSSDIIESSEVEVEAPIAKIRLKIDETHFIDVFRNFKTSTVSYSLIEDKERIYAADKDSVRGWHIHPFEDPRKHRESDEMKFEEFLSEVEKYFKS